jgi:hypothetical protein
MIFKGEIMRSAKLITKNNQQKMTLKEVAKVTGAAYRTIADYAQRAGWTQNGKKALLDELQVTAIIEAMKESSGQGGKRAAAGKARLALAMQGQETTQSLDFQLALVERKAHELWKRKALEQEARAVRAETKVLDLEWRNDRLASGCETHQRMLESGGFIMSDSDDLLALYGRTV